MLLPFFALSFVYLWLVVEPRLIYYSMGTILSNAPQFATGWTFLEDSLGTPGGFVAYISGFLSLGFYYSWLGAAITSRPTACCNPPLNEVRSRPICNTTTRGRPTPWDGWPTHTKPCAAPSKSSPTSRRPMPRALSFR